MPYTLLPREDSAGFLETLLIIQERDRSCNVLLLLLLHGLSRRRNDLVHVLRDDLSGGRMREGRVFRGEYGRRVWWISLGEAIQGVLTGFVMADLAKVKCLELVLGLLRVVFGDVARV